MLRALGAALVQAGRATNETDDILHAIAHAYGRPEIRVLVMPTAIIIQLVGETTHTEIDSIDVPPAASRPDRRDREAHQRDAAAPPRTAESCSTGSQEIRALEAALQRFRQSDRSRRAHARVRDGARADGRRHAGVRDPRRRRRRADRVGRPGTILGDSMPIVAAFTVTVLTGTLLDWSVHDDAVRVITPPLVSFLPGLAAHDRRDRAHARAGDRRRQPPRVRALAAGHIGVRAGGRDRRRR